MEIWKILGDNAVKMIDPLVVVTSFKEFKGIFWVECKLSSICGTILVSLTRKKKKKEVNWELKTEM